MKAYIPRILSDDGMIENEYGNYPHLMKYIRMDDYARVTRLVNEQCDLIARLQLEAQIHAQEAHTANATIAEIYQVVSRGTGEPGNWHGAEPVRRVMQEQREEIRLLEEKLKGLCCAHGNALMQIYDKDKEITRLRGALTALLAHIDRVAYRDTTGLRLGDAVPFYVAAKQALTQEPT